MLLGVRLKLWHVCSGLRKPAAKPEERAQAFNSSQRALGWCYRDVMAAVTREQHDDRRPGSGDGRHGGEERIAGAWHMCM